MRDCYTYVRIRPDPDAFKPNKSENKLSREYINEEIDFTCTCFIEYPADKERNESEGCSQTSLIIRRIVTVRLGDATNV